MEAEANLVFAGQGSMYSTEAPGVSAEHEVLPMVAQLLHWQDTAWVTCDFSTAEAGS